MKVMMSSDRKKIALIFVALVFLVGVLVVAKWKLTQTESNGQVAVPNEAPIFAADHKRVSTDNEQVIQNTQCDFTFKIPKDWNVYGILGESKILSPEDERINEEWLKSPEGQAPAEEGSAGPALGPDARSLYISCQDIGKIDDLKPSAIKTIKINGRDAYEFADTGKMPDGTPFTNYRLVVEAEKTTEIHLGQTEYENLSETIKQIIQSISFEK